MGDLASSSGQRDRADARVEFYHELTRRPVQIKGPDGEYEVHYVLSLDQVLDCLDRFMPFNNRAFKQGGPFCRRGHMYEPGAIQRKIKGGKVYLVRVCRQCHNESSRRHRARKRAGADA